MHTFEPDLDAWDAWPPAEIAARLAGTGVPWYIAGGWALSLFLGSPLRAHGDLELAVPAARFTEVAARFPDCDFVVPSDDPGASHQTWARERATGRWRFDVFREPSDGATWVCRRDPAVRLPYDELIEWTDDGIPYGRPEVVLLFKAKARREKDEDDLAAVLPSLPPERRRWLADALARVHGPDHPWVSRVAGR